MSDENAKSDDLLKTGSVGAIELTESELAQAVGGTDKSGNGLTFGVQKDKMASATKNAAATKALL
jgi:hypothetical protein